MFLALLAGCHRAPATPATELDVMTAEPWMIAGPARGCGGEEARWVSRNSGRDQVWYSSLAPDDGERGLIALQRTRAALAAALDVRSDQTPPASLWLATGSAIVGPGRAMTVSDPVRADIHMASPACDPDPRRLQFERTLVHELAGEYLHAATRSGAPGGWSFYSAPPWFVQGAEQWLTRLVHDQPADVRAAATAQIARSPPGAVSTSSGAIAVAEVYRDGEAVVAWLTLEFGETFLVGLLTNDAACFEAALREATGRDQADLVTAFEAARNP